MDGKHLFRHLEVLLEVGDLESAISLMYLMAVIYITKVLGYILFRCLRLPPNDVAVFQFHIWRNPMVWKWRIHQAKFEARRRRWRGFLEGCSIMRWKYDGSKSGEYDGMWKTFQLNPWIATFVMLIMWGHIILKNHLMMSFRFSFLH